MPQLTMAIAIPIRTVAGAEAINCSRGCELSRPEDWEGRLPHISALCGVAMALVAHAKRRKLKLLGGEVGDYRYVMILDDRQESSGVD